MHRLASALGLAGWVRNGPEGVTIEVEGTRGVAWTFVEQLPRSLPPLAHLEELDVLDVAPLAEQTFSVVLSAGGERAGALVPPDTALCADCRREMEDPADRRFHYPFTTCTNCGPRFSLVRSLPYDRERTSMGCFPLCPDCGREYGDPADRRFHAEPVCCPVCGPRVWMERRGTGDRGQGTGTPTRPRDTAVVAEGIEAVRAARAALERGEIVAVKALGGFQLACRGDDAAAVTRLRERKHRASKPFALMVESLEAARRIVRLDAADEALLTSGHAPVVLAPARPGAPVAVEVAPGLDDLGVMLPTAPLHVELLRGLDCPCLVMTSGNASDEPICRGNREALERLGGIADAFLLHDRDVVRRVDDSVARSSSRGPFVVRRARGYVPEPLPLPEPTPRPVLALGGYLQSTACVAVDRQAYLSQHVGDLDSEGARAFLVEVVDGLEEFLQVRPEVIAVDAHPDYASTSLGERLAGERGARLVRVQHHLAHAAAVLAEHGRFPAVGEHAAAIALDGTGWGPDGTAWGGEWLLAGGDLSWQRRASLEPLLLVGGEAAVREPWRVLVAALVRAGEADLLDALPVARLVPSESLNTVARLSESDAWPRASGAGRLFEAAGALLGLVVVNGWEGEAAARLEALAATAAAPAPWEEVALAADGGPSVLPGGALLAAAARRLRGGAPPAEVAAGFHTTFCRLAVELARRCMPAGVSTIALGGGCLVNRILRDGLAGGLREAGFMPLLPFRVPPGDGGLSYGQAVLAALAGAKGAHLDLEGA